MASFICCLSDILPDDLVPLAPEEVPEPVFSFLDGLAELELDEDEDEDNELRLCLLERFLKVLLLELLEEEEEEEEEECLSLGPDGPEGRRLCQAPLP